MLGKNYLRIDDLPIPNPKVNKVSYENIETVNQSEAGSDLVSVTLLQKRTWSLTFNSTSYWLEKYEALCKRTQSILKVGDREIPVRCRITAANLVENSELVQNTNGLYEISIEIKELGVSNV